MLFSLKTAISTPYIQLPNSRQTMLKCPFCNGEHFLINGETFVCYDCFSNGDIVDFLAVRDGISHKKATWKATKDKPVKKRLNEIYRCNAIAADYYHKKLNVDNYFIKRGVDKNIVDEFNLGYAPYDGKELLSLLKSKGISEATISEAKLFYPDSEVRPFFQNRVIFPIYDENGKVRGFSGRRIKDNNKKAPKYLNTSENLVFHKKDLLYGLHKAVGNKNIYLVEGQMDVIALHQAGISNAIAALGTAVGVNHCSLLKELGVQKVHLCLDSDSPGIKASINSIEVLKNYFEVDVVLLNNAKDPDEYIKLFGVEAFKLLPKKSGESFAISKSKNKASAALDCLCDQNEL